MYYYLPVDNQLGKTMKTDITLGDLIFFTAGATTDNIFLLIAQMTLLWICALITMDHGILIGGGLFVAVAGVFILLRELFRSMRRVEARATLKAIDAEAKVRRHAEFVAYWAETRPGEKYTNQLDD
jgi:hypothetical protein